MDVIFYPRVLRTIVSGIENYPSASMSCCSDNLAQLRAQTFEVWGLKIYQSKNKFLPLLADNVFFYITPL